MTANNSTQFEDNKWVKAAQKGNQDAMSQLYSRYVKRLYHFIYYKTLNVDLAQDLTSQVFLKVVENLPAFQLTQVSFSSWLFAIARNLVIDHFRTAHPRDNLEDIWDLSTGEDVEMDAVNRDRYERLHQHIQMLSAEKRELLMMRLWQDLSFQEIADLLDQSLGSCKMAFYRLIKQLKEEMPALIFLLLILKP